MTDQEVSSRPKVTNVDFRDLGFFHELVKSKELNEFLLALALCHTALT